MWLSKWLFDSVAPALAPQRRDVDAERFGRFFEGGAGPEHARYMLTLDFIEAGGVGDAGERLGRFVKQRIGQVVGRDRLAPHQDGAAFDRVAQLAHIAGPSVARQRRDRSG